MTINIPENTFSHPEPREEVVQLICDRLLDGSTFKTSRYETACFVRKGRDVALGFRDKRMAEKYPEDECVKFYESEMNAAFAALREAGYHIFRCGPSIFESDWTNYECRKEDYHPSSRYDECEELHPLSHWD